MTAPTPLSFSDTKTAARPDNAECGRRCSARGSLRSTFRPSRAGIGRRARLPERRAFACLGFPASPGLAEETMLDTLASGLRRDYNRPTFHVAPRSGWMNDPNGPFYHNGEYHLFYQHIVNGCEWDFGIVWGHAVSKDLVRWEHLAHALLPTPGGTDADGCFSGCSVVDTDGTPTILYTGVRLRSNPECGPLPPAECDLDLPFIESQLVAVADSADSSLETWVKQEEPMIATPPSNMELVGWRDPYIFETKSQHNSDHEWGMLMGSGVKGKGGTVLIYRSKSLRSGWRYDGVLCSALDLGTGAMWECPLLIELNQVPEKADRASLAAIQALGDSFNNISAFRETVPEDSAKSAKAAAANAPAEAAKSEGVYNNGNGVHQGSALGGSGRPIVDPTDEETSTSGQENSHYTHFLCISPDAPTNPVLYWLGDFDSESTRFLLEKAKGPLRLDLGDVLYAPNLMVDDKGRHILWGWLQERRKVGSYDYAGCMSLPRVIYSRGGKLIQEPAPEVAGLRVGQAWQAHNVKLFPEESLPIEGVAGPAIEVQTTIQRGSAAAAGILIRSWNASDEGGAAIVYDWERGVLEAIFEGDSDIGSQAELDASHESQKRFGGPVDMQPDKAVQMRVLLDGSCVEVYLATGEVLTTRVYRGEAPRGADAGVDLVSFGGVANAVCVDAWEMSSIWQRDHGIPSDAFEPSSIMGAPVPA